ncbi:MAG TPA: CheR family methyltransferase, partial [Candidatus Polarisedimenticolaceae bacterium]|nr:CheR family methyltransferase [Candidatus Polarisedimenticolaceae bacterium]
MHESQSSSSAVVGIGASAGGITALQSLFRSIPPKPGLAFVVIQHLQPGYSTHLPQLISKWTSMGTHLAADGVRPEADNVYVARAEDVLTLENGAFRTQPRDGGLRPGIQTVDLFFESLAVDRGPRAIAVVLSGTGMDGAAGALRIRQEGGVVLVQDPITALHDGMPLAAVAGGSADHVLPVGAMEQQLVACASPSYVRPASTATTATDLMRTLDEILGLVRQQAGLDLAAYKTTPLLWRIQQRMNTRRVGTFQDYEALLRDDPVELEALIRGIPIHVTEFFRDPAAWEVLDREVIEPLVSGGGSLRAWTPACATGEEAYSLAMLLDERGGAFQVFATDASPEILARASRGMFASAAVQALSAERRARFFYTVDGGWRVKKSLRERMVFAAHDLLADPPFSGLDIVTCRNLLIYLEPEAGSRVVNLLHGSLNMGGYLFLGRGESLSPRQKGFETVSQTWHVYRKVGPATGIKVSVPKR